MRFVDTNIFLRFLVNDDPEKADACEALFQRAIAGKESLITSEMVIAEIVWVLESYYQLEKSDIQERVEKILNTPNLNCPNMENIINALSLYVERNIDYIDAFNSFLLITHRINELYSYDKDFDRVEWLKRIEPQR